MLEFCPLPEGIVAILPSLRMERRPKSPKVEALAMCRQKESVLRKKGMTLYQRARLHPVAEFVKYEVKSSLVQLGRRLAGSVYKFTELSGRKTRRWQPSSVRQPSPAYIIFRRQSLAII